MVRGPISMAIVGAIALAAVALVVGGPRAFEGILPPQVLDMVEAMAQPTDFDLAGRSGDSPADFLDDDTDGLQAKGPIAAAAGNEPVFIKDVISGYTTRAGSDTPAEITTIRQIMGCRPTPPQAGSTVAHVRAGASKIDLAMSTYNDSHLAAAVQQLVNAYRSSGTTALLNLSGPSYQAYDVAVTETAAPIYLVLETGPGLRMWNLHLAPGARIERVVLLGGSQAGIANLDPVVPVEVILDDGLQSCGIQPAYALNQGAMFFQSVELGVISDEEAETRLAQINDRVAAYDTWFRDTFGIEASTSRIGFDQGTLSVVGPVPAAEEPKAVYASIEGAKIRMTQDRFFEIRGQVAEGEDFAARVKAIALTFAFGDLQYLRQGASF
jgi:hypothetical protein